MDNSPADSQTVKFDTSASPADLEMERLADEFRAAFGKGDQPPDRNAFAARVAPEHRDALLEVLADVERELREEGGFPKIPGYELVELLADRNMAIVYKAVAHETNDVVVVKILRDAERERAPRQEAIWQIEREVVAGLDHPNIVRVKEIGSHKGLVYLVMPYIEGGDLGQRIEEFSLFGEFDADERKRRTTIIAKLMEQVASAIAYVHSRALIHRDLKSSNILIDNDNNALVCDFGLARRLQDPVKLTLSGQLIGTIEYMAPEQARGEAMTTTAADIWSIGAVLYELLTGHPPFCERKLSMMALLGTKVAPGATPVPPSELNQNVEMDSELERICLMCLEYDPANRFATAEQLAEALRRFINGETQPGPSWLERLIESFKKQIHRPPAQSDYVRRWRKALRTEAGTALIAHGAVLALVLSGAPGYWIWAAFLLGDTLCGWSIWYVFIRRARLTAMERNLMQLWTGTDASALLLFAVTVPLSHPPDVSSIATFYTAYLMMRGLVFFVEGRMCWGGLYAVSAAFYVAVLVVQLLPIAAPVIYGVTYATAFVCISFFQWDQQPSPHARLT